MCFSHSCENEEEPLMPDQAVMIEFMSGINDIPESERDFEAIQYSFQGDLNQGSPVDSATLCTWIYVKNRRRFDIVWDLYFMEMTDDRDYHYAAIGGKEHDHINPIASTL